MIPAILALVLAAVVHAGCTARHRHLVRARVAPGQRAARELPSWLRDRVLRCGATEPERVVRLWAGASALALTAAVVMPAARLVAPAVVLGGPIALVTMGDRAEQRRVRQLPVALDAVAAALRSGTGLTQAIAETGIGAPLGTELVRLAGEVEGGRRFEEAVSSWMADRPDRPTVLAGTALTLAATVGGDGARAVDAATAGLREHQAVDAELQALATQGRASALVLTVAPLVFAVLLGGIDPRAGAFLTSTPAGMACLVAGLSLDGAGAWWMSRLVKRAR